MWLYLDVISEFKDSSLKPTLVRADNEHFNVSSLFQGCLLLIKLIVGQMCVYICDAPDVTLAFDDEDVHAHK